MDMFSLRTKEADRAELECVCNVMCKGREQPLPVGSIKSNIGHCEAVAGKKDLMGKIF